MLSLFLCSLQQIVSKLGGGLAGFRAECRDKIDLAPKSCAERDLADRKAGRVQQRFRLVDTVEHDILMRRKAGRGAENTREMRCAEIDVRGDAADRELLGQMAVDEAHRLRDCIVFRGTVRALRQEEDPEVARQVLESAEYIWTHKKKHKGPDARLQNWRVLYFYAAARYHAGVGSLEDVVKILLESAGSVAQDDYSAEAINRKLVLAAYLSVYAERLDEAGAQRYRTTVEQVRRSAYQYLEQMPASQYPRVVNSAAWELSKINTSSDETANRRMLGSILAGHKPTYVHSLMVAELTRALLHRQIETRPETLVGLLGCRSAAEVQTRREELCQTAYECGLYHDLGKCAVLMYIDNNARRLLDEEFFCIQSHPRTGAAILNRMGCGRTLAPAALYHHCYYNGKGGYPNDVPSCPPEIKGIVDALSVADSLDAATDNIGRCYNLAKPFHALLEELRAQSDTRYAPNVVALFEDGRFCQQLAENTDAERKRVYLQVYHAGSEEK